MIKTVKTESKWAGGMRVEAQARNHSVTIDQPEKMMGKDVGADPMEHFLISLGGCLGTVAAIIANQERIQLQKFSVEIEGDFDLDFIMGKTTEGHAGFSEIRETVFIDADLSDEEKRAFFEKVHFRCPVTNSILHQTKIVYEVN